METVSETTHADADADADIPEAYRRTPRVSTVFFF